MFEGVRRLVHRRSSDDKYSSEVAVAEVDNVVDRGATNESLAGADGWTEPEGAVCDHEVS